MSLTVVGSVALDTVTTPTGTNVEGLGGAATFFSLAARPYTPVNLVGVVGEDFPEAHVELFRSKDINIDGLERAGGADFPLDRQVPRRCEFAGYPGHAIKRL